jgi:hypothetical protein
MRIYYIFCGIKGNGGFQNKKRTRSFEKKNAVLFPKNQPFFSKERVFSPKKKIGRFRLFFFSRSKEQNKIRFSRMGKKRNMSAVAAKEQTEAGKGSGSRTTGPQLLTLDSFWLLR